MIAPERVGAFAFVGEGARIGARTILHPTRDDSDRVAEIGDDCVIHARVSIRERVVLGNRVVLQDGVVIGSDGFGFARRRDGSHEKIPQIGGVVLEDDVEIGAKHDDRSSSRRRNAHRRRHQDRQPGPGRARRESGTPRAPGGAGGHRRQQGDRGSTSRWPGRSGVAGHVTIGKGTIATAQTGIPNSVEAGRASFPAIRPFPTATGSRRRRSSGSCRSCAGWSRTSSGESPSSRRSRAPLLTLTTFLP